MLDAGRHDPPAGFGHVIVNRRHELTLDRGVSFVALDAAGHASLRAWAGGLLAPQPRFIVRPRGRCCNVICVGLTRAHRDRRIRPRSLLVLSWLAARAGAPGGAFCRRSRAEPAAEVRAGARLLGRLRAHLRGRRPQEEADRARHAAREEAGHDAMDLHEPGEEGVRVRRPARSIRTFPRTGRSSSAPCRPPTRPAARRCSWPARADILSATSRRRSRACRGLAASEVALEARAHDAAARVRLDHPRRSTGRRCRSDG